MKLEKEFAEIIKSEEGIENVEIHSIKENNEWRGNASSGQDYEVNFTILDENYDAFSKNNTWIIDLKNKKSVDEVFDFSE